MSRFLLTYAVLTNHRKGGRGTQGAQVQRVCLAPEEPEKTVRWRCSFYPASCLRCAPGYCTQAVPETGTRALTIVGSCGFWFIETAEASQCYQNDTLGRGSGRSSRQPDAWEIMKLLRRRCAHRGLLRQLTVQRRMGIHGDGDQTTTLESTSLRRRTMGGSITRVHDQNTLRRLAWLTRTVPIGPLPLGAYTGTPR